MHHAGSCDSDSGGGFQCCSRPKTTTTAAAAVSVCYSAQMQLKRHHQHRYNHHHHHHQRTLPWFGEQKQQTKCERNRDALVLCCRRRRRFCCCCLPCLFMSALVCWLRQTSIYNIHIWLAPLCLFVYLYCYIIIISSFFKKFYSKSFITIVFISITSDEHQLITFDDHARTGNFSGLKLINKLGHATIWSLKKHYTSTY